METLAHIEKKTVVQIKSLALAEKENKTILSSGKENKLVKQQEFIKKHLGKLTI